MNEAKNKEQSSEKENIAQTNQQMSELHAGVACSIITSLVAFVVSVCVIGRFWLCAVVSATLSVMLCAVYICILGYVNSRKSKDFLHFIVDTIRWGELIKAITLIAWLGFCGWLMYQIYSNPISISNKSDVWSNLIAILGIIVATLIGWQIYSAMDWNSKVERLSKIESLYDKLSLDVLGNRNYSEATYLAISAERMLNDALKAPEEDKDDFPKIYKNFLQAIRLFGASSVEEAIESCIMQLYGLIEYMGRYQSDLDDDFHAHCDTLYEKIKSENKFITKAQLGKLKEIHNRRIGLKSE